MSQNKISEKVINWELVAVNPSTKNWDWKDLFCFWGVNIQSIIGFSLIAALYKLYNLNFLVVFLGTILGSFLVYFFSNLIGKPSQKYGLPFATLLRSSLGYNGARFFGFLRSLVGIFMFGIQTYFLSKAISYLIRILFFTIDKSILDQDIFLTFLLGLNIIDWSSLFLCVLIQIYIFSQGMLYNRKIINFSAIAVYTGMFFFFIIILLSDVKLTARTFVEIFNFDNFLDYKNLFPIISVAGTIFAYFSIIIISLGDFSRYIKNEKELKNGNLSLLANLIIFSIFAVFIVTGSDIFLKQQFNDIEKILTNPTDISSDLKNSRDMGIDPERMGVFGFSAGGHLSLILGTMGGNETPNWLNKVRAKRREATDKAESPSDYEVTAPVAAVVAWFAPCDLQTVAGPSLRFPALDIDPNRAEEVSPALHVDTGDAPTMLFHGTQDIVCPVVSSRFMHGALTSAEVPTEIKIYEGQGHGFNGDPERESAEMAKAWFDRWLLKTRSSTPDQN